VDQDTPYAVPAILDGRLPRRELLPVAADHPQNIFSLLGGTYELHVREDATTLCAPRLCAATASDGFFDRMRSLSSDAGLAYAHLVLPDRLERESPAVTRAWRRFDTAGDTKPAVAYTRRTRRETKRHRYVRLHANLAGGRRPRFEHFVAGIEGGSRPRLHLIHILLPHVPYQFLPSGRRYSRTPREALPGLDSRPGYGVPFLVRQSYQRHLLQLQDTDRLLGELLDRLHEVAIYDRAIVAVVADHGISFRLGHDRRLVRAANVEDIVPVPFFVKAPGQRRGRISDKPLRTIDVLPTLADLLGVRIPWRIDGRSALEPTTAAQRHRRIVSKKFRHVYAVDTPTYEHDLRAALARKLRLFGADTDAVGPRRELAGRRTAGLAVLPQGRDRALVARAGEYRRVDPDTGFVPTHLVGRIAPGKRGGGRVLAVAVNGAIAATGRTFSLAGSEDEQFSLLIPERALRRGRNRLELLLAGDTLRRLGKAP
jgi:Sulfatase